jgi:tryptophan synthase alpha chain
VPVVLFSYLNPLWRFGLERLTHEASEAGIDGILVTDIVGKEAGDIGKTFSSRGIDLISLVAPTTTDERLESIAALASGFIYAVSRAGVTGARTEASSDAGSLVSRVRKYTDLPVAVGFGISTREQIEDVWRYADAAVVGSAIVAEIEKCNGKDVVPVTDQFIDMLLPPRG